EILEFIESRNYNLNSIPKKGELIYLREKTNVSTGGDPVDVTDDMPQRYKQIAIDAVKAIPGLHHAGVENIINENKNHRNPAVVIELNPTEQTGGIVFPLRGKATDTTKAMND